MDLSLQTSRKKTENTVDLESEKFLNLSPQQILKKRDELEKKSIIHNYEIRKDKIFRKANLKQKISIENEVSISSETEQSSKSHFEAIDKRHDISYEGKNSNLFPLSLNKEDKNGAINSETLKEKFKLDQSKAKAKKEFDE